MTEDEMVGWHHRLNGHEFGWTPGAGDGQGGLACCCSWGHRELDTTEQLDNDKSDLLQNLNKQQNEKGRKEKKKGIQTIEPRC